VKELEQLMRNARTALGVLVVVISFFGFRLYDRYSADRTARQAITSILSQLPEYQKKKSEVDSLFEGAHTNAFQRYYKWSWDRKKQNSFDEVSYVRDVFGMIENGARSNGSSDLADDLINLQVAVSVLMPDDNPLKRVFAEKISKLPKPEPTPQPRIQPQVDFDRLRAELANKKTVMPTEELTPEVTLNVSVASSDRKHLRHGSVASLYFLTDGRTTDMSGGCYRAIENFVPEDIDWSNFEETEKAALKLQLDLDQPRQKVLRKVLEAIKNEPIFCLRRADSISSAAHYGTARTMNLASCDCKTDIPDNSGGYKSATRNDGKNKSLEDLRNEQRDLTRWRKFNGR
jgi:hypothetical protein